jgi:hypothetical protein
MRLGACFVRVSYEPAQTACGSTRSSIRCCEKGCEREASRRHAAWWGRDGLDGAGVQWCASGWRPVRCEHTCHERAGMRGARGYQAGPALAPELLADLLVGRPGVATRAGLVQCDVV